MDNTAASPERRSRRRTAYALLTLGCILFAVAFLVGVSDNPPGVLSMLAGFFAVSLGAVLGFGKPAGRRPARQLLYWAPRALCIAFAVFVSLFALDVFDEGLGFWRTALALLMHLMPTFLILLVLAVCWHREWIGGVLFNALAALYVVWAWNKPFAAWSTLLLIAGPLVLTGALFLLNWRYGRPPAGLQSPRRIHGGRRLA